TLTAMSKRVSRLLGLEIDEVSLVDRPANQHGVVTITKRDEDPVDEIFDEQGNPIDPESLEAGDVFYDADGQKLQVLTEEQAAELEGLEVPDDASELDDYDDQYDEGDEGDEFVDPRERQLAGVGKAAPAITGGA